jgi:hypothetical protein
MTAPVVRQFVGTIPDKGQSQTAFDTNVDAFLDWQALEFAPDLVAFVTWADGIRAALVSGNLPSLTGRELDAVRVNAAGDGVEFADVTAAGWALLDDADAAAQRVTLGLVIGTDMPSFASPTFTGTPTAPTAAAATDTTQIATTAYTRTAIADVLNAAGSAPLYACRAWVNFDGGGTVAIQGSGNVSSITDNGVGDYTVNFSTSMPISNYAVGLSTQGVSLGDLTRIAVIRSNGGIPTLKTTSALRIATGRTSAQDVNDVDGVSVMIFC